ncbi:membrane protein [Actinorhabdospora filicis]|uniref:Membrane protein n=1 Tax=Actinorhabdospora filicis TaxID=1785913 RepID=A0A9W6W6S5_9ACTN|nr:PH domain-containing protein [Actinorhabdospora filicis]GLZ75233.1 membrane protein [Actinorhabdospora filicis]
MAVRETVSVEPLVIRPRKARVACWIAAVAVALVFTGLAFTLTGETDGGGQFEPVDQIAMVGLGLLGAAVILLFTRPLIRADENGVHVRNVIGSYDLPWQVVRAVRFNRGASWASLELQDDDEVSLMAIQAVDKENAVAAVRSLRAMLAAVNDAD